MLDVAFSRRMCCSRVCIAMRSAGFPWLSLDTPITRPGIERLNASFVARKAACGPPNPIGTPKRWAEPKTMSAPISPGDFNRTSDSRSTAMLTSAPCSCAWAMAGVKSVTVPSMPGYWKIAPKTSCCAKFSMSSTTTSISSSSARVLTTSMVCGKQWLATNNLSLFLRLERFISVIASAAAVASSNKEAFEISMPVRSMITCWKLSSASKRP